MAFTDGAPDAPPDAQAGPPGAGGGPDAQQGPPGGGGPILAALARSQQGPQVSAPGAGNTADSLNLLRTAIGMLEKALPGFPDGSQQKRDIYGALQRLGRHMSQSDSTAGVEKTQFTDMIRNIAQSPLLARIRQMLAGGQGQGGPPPTPPMPSTPLPGS